MLHAVYYLTSPSHRPLLIIHASRYTPKQSSGGSNKSGRVLLGGSHVNLNTKLFFETDVVRLVACNNLQAIGWAHLQTQNEVFEKTSVVLDAYLATLPVSERAGYRAVATVALPMRGNTSDASVAMGCEAAKEYFRRGDVGGVPQDVEVGPIMQGGLAAEVAASATAAKQAGDVDGTEEAGPSRPSSSQFTFASTTLSANSKPPPPPHVLPAVATSTL